MEDLSKMGPGLWMQLSPEMQARADAAWKEQMAKPVEQRMREYCEAALRGLELFKEVFTTMQQDANIEATNKLTNMIPPRSSSGAIHPVLTTSTKVGKNITAHHYIGFIPKGEEMEQAGWFYDPLGASAEGPSYRKIVGENIYHLQIVQQGPGNESVINTNRGIEGYQNCHISGPNCDWLGYVYNMDDIHNACLEAGIK